MSGSASQAPFVGREREVAALRERIDAARGGAGGVVLVAGEAGIGKSRLIGEVAAQAQADGWTVLSGRAHQEEGLPAYLPFIDAIRAHVRATPPATLRAQLGAGAGDLALLVRELRAVFADLPDLPSRPAESERYQLFESVGDFLIRVAKEGRAGLLLSLDDLHWADPTSLRLLLHLARRLVGAPLLIVGTYRDTDVGREHPLAAVRAELVREQVSDQITLAGLGEGEVARFVGLATGNDPPPGLAATIHRDTEGNPLFMVELVRLLHVEGRLDAAGARLPWRLSLPQSVQQVIGRRLDQLSAACNEALTLAAFIGREFSLQALARTLAGGESALSAEELLDVLEEAEAARVITASPETPGHFSFAHPLIRETAYRQVLSSRRVRLHRQVGEALAAFYRANPEPHLAELAHHFVQAAPLGDTGKAVAFARAAGDRAMALLAYEDAARFYETALQTRALAGLAGDHEGCELLLALAGAQSRAGQTAVAKQNFLRAAELARLLDLAEPLARAGIGYGGYRGTPGVVDLRLVELLEEAVPKLGDGDLALRARARARLAMELYNSDARARRDQLSREAVAEARRSGDPATLAAALVGRHYAMHDPENLAERAAAAAELVSLAEAGGDREVALQGYYLRVIDLLEAGDIEGADRAIAAHERLGEELRQPLYRWRTDLLLATRHLIAGRFADAAERADRARAIGQQAQIANTLPAYGTQAVLIRAEAGGLDALESPLRALVAQYPGLPAYRGALAILYARLGRAADAQAQLEAVAAANFDDYPRDDNFLSGLAGLVEACAYLGDRRHAGRLYELLLPFADRLVILNAAIGWFGPVTRCLGLLAATMGDRQAAEGYFAAARATCERIGARGLLARLRVDLVAMRLPDEHAAPDEPLDHAQAGALLAEARAEAEACGMVYLLGEIEALGERLAASAAWTRRSSPITPHASFPDGLSTREVEVLRLVAVGRTSREIADELVLSRRTVDHHVANILTKINARRRADATAYAHRHGLVESGVGSEE